MQNKLPNGSESQAVNLDEILKKRNSFQENILQLGQHRLEFSKENERASEEFVVRIGEFSLAIAAAIVPVIIITENDIARPLYVFSAIALYLVVGFYGMFSRKSRLEKESTGLASFGYEHEIQIRDLLYLANKVVHEPKNSDFVNEYYEAEKTYLESPSGTMVPSRVGHSLDIALGAFIFTTLILAGVIWPYDWESHALILVIFVISYLLYILYDSQEAMRRIELGRSLRQKLVDKSNEHFSWYIKGKHGK